MLSVSGMRGIVGASLTPAEVITFAAAFVVWASTQGHAAGRSGRPVIVVGRDSRPSGQALASAVLGAVAAAGADAIDLGICTTPAAGLMVRKRHAWGGLVLTASHNPGEWNGIKPIRADGASLPPDQANDLIDAFRTASIAWAPADRVGGVTQDPGADAAHVDAVLSHIDIDVVRRAGLKVVVDSVHGAGGASAAMLLDRLGVVADMRYVEPTGEFPHTPEPVADNLTELCAAVADAEADLGFAQDPDADRLALVGPDGAYLGEECTLVAAAMHVLQAGGVAVANLSTSRMIDDVAEAVGGRVVRSAVGEANVAAAMREHDAVIGGEGNGGVIWPAVGQIRDSLAGMALVLELLATRGRAIDALLEPHRGYTILKDKVPADPALAQGLAQALHDAFPNGTADTTDGVRIDEGKAWVHVRPSNTEPIFRLIAEARTPPAARDLLDRARVALGID
jgi:phosphomannomutase